MHSFFIVCQLLLLIILPKSLLNNLIFINIKKNELELTQTFNLRQEPLSATA